PFTKPSRQWPRAYQCLAITICALYYVCNVFIYIDSCAPYLFTIYLFTVYHLDSPGCLHQTNSALLNNNKTENSPNILHAFCRSAFDLPHKGLELTYCTLYMLEGINRYYHGHINVSHGQSYWTMCAS